MLFKFVRREIKENFFTITNRSMVGTLIIIGEARVSIAIYSGFFLAIVAMGFGQLYSYFIFSHCTARMTETSDHEEELLHAKNKILNGSSNRGNEL